jgi:hypothetical protein
MADSPGINAGDQGGSGLLKVLSDGGGDTTSSKQGGDGMGSNPSTLSASTETTGHASGPSKKF